MVNKKVSNADFFKRETGIEPVSVSRLESDTASGPPSRGKNPHDGCLG